MNARPDLLPTARTAPDLRPRSEELATLAGRAPSLHNSQPWSFRVERTYVDVLLDRNRLLPVADPKSRQAHLSLGAAVFILRVALSTMDRAVEVVPWPDPAEPDVVARLVVGDPKAASEQDRRLLAAVQSRRTVRTRFAAGVLPVPLQVAWQNDAESEGAAVRWVEASGERDGVSALVAMAERLQQRDPAYLAELDRWTTVGRVARAEGVPAHAFGATAAAGHSAEFPLRDFAGGRRVVPQRSSDALEDRPVVVVLHTPGDRPEDWLHGGQALMRILLMAADHGFAASYLNQPLELSGLRHQIRDELRLQGWPQLILRLGRPAGPLPPLTPRRPARDLLLPPDGAAERLAHFSASAAGPDLTRAEGPDGG